LDLIVEKQKTAEDVKVVVDTSGDFMTLARGWYERRDCLKTLAANMEKGILPVIVTHQAGVMRIEIQLPAIKPVRPGLLFTGTPVFALPLFLLISPGSLSSLTATIGASTWPWLAAGVVLIALGVIWVQAVRAGPEDQEAWMTKNTLSSRQRLIRPRLAPRLFTVEDISFSWFDMPGGAAAVKAILGQVRAWLARVRAGGGRMPGLLGRLFLKAVAYQESAPAETDIPGLFEADGFHRLLRDHIVLLLAQKQAADPAQPLRWLSAGGVNVTARGARALKPWGNVWPGFALAQQCRSQTRALAWPAASGSA
jgi:hypothetical protein